VAKNPKDDMALWFWCASWRATEKKRDAGDSPAEQCATCCRIGALQHALGTLFGAAAQSGAQRRAQYAGRIKEEFVKAAESHPKFFEGPRRDLGQFYLQAPASPAAACARP